MSEQFKLDQRVPQGSCLGPVVFTDYSSPVFSVIDQHGKLGHATPMIIKFTVVSILILYTVTVSSWNDALEASIDGCKA